MTDNSRLDSHLRLAGFAVAGMALLLIVLLWWRQAPDTSSRLEMAPGEWRVQFVDDGLLPKIVLASLPATDGDLVVAVRCADDIVAQVVVGFANEPPSIWVHGGLYLSVDGGPVRSNWSRSRDGYSHEPWRGFRDELQLLDGPMFLEQLAASAQLVVEASQVSDHPFTIAATFDGSGLPATLAQMGCSVR